MDSDSNQPMQCGLHVARCESVAHRKVRDGMTLASARAELDAAIDRIPCMFPWRTPDALGVGRKSGASQRITC
jgi:hypothetical protein